MEILRLLFIDGLKDIIGIFFIFFEFCIHFLSFLVQPIVLRLKIAKHFKHLIFQDNMIFNINFFLSWQINANIFYPCSFLELNALYILEEKGNAVVIG